MDFVLQRAEEVSAASLATHVWERRRGAMLCSKGNTRPGDDLREVARLHEASVAGGRRPAFGGHQRGRLPYRFPPMSGWPCFV